MEIFNWRLFIQTRILYFQFQYVLQPSTVGGSMHTVGPSTLSQYCALNFNSLVHTFVAVYGVK